jgi:hypothetical protein
VSVATLKLAVPVNPPANRREKRRLAALTSRVMGAIVSGDESEPRGADMAATHITGSAHRARELAYRAHDGLEVTLSWQPANDELTVCVCDRRRGAYFVVQPEPGEALDAFYHPYSYESSSVVHYEDERLAA